MFKQTINLSTIDKIVTQLKKDDIYYNLSRIIRIKGRGVNDFDMAEDHKVYTLRKLTYKNTVILEKMILIDNMQLDDFIISYKFASNNSPYQWAAVEKRLIK